MKIHGTCQYFFITDAMYFHQIASTTHKQTKFHVNSLALPGSLYKSPHACGWPFSVNRINLVAAYRWEIHFEGPICFFDMVRWSTWSFAVIHLFWIIARWNWISCRVENAGACAISVYWCVLPFRTAMVLFGEINFIISMIRVRLVYGRFRELQTNWVVWVSNFRSLGFVPCAGVRVVVFLMVVGMSRRSDWQCDKVLQG